MTNSGGGSGGLGGTTARRDRGRKGGGGDAEPPPQNIKGNDRGRVPVADEDHRAVPRSVGSATIAAISLAGEDVAHRKERAAVARGSLGRGKGGGIQHHNDNDNDNNDNNRDVQQLHKYNSTPYA